ncbi:MAG: P-II family nitrogen regulator [Lachnospiraceae bacterium]|nr:P-II family nitrogen regulator [Lachnospiraceae bacterium]
MSLSKIEIITNMSKLTKLKKALSDAGVTGMTVIQVLGCGIEKGTFEYAVDENEEMELLPKQQINLVVKTEDVPRIVELVKQELYTGHIGDGKIFVYKIDNAIRVRTGDEGLDALSH